MCRLAERCGPSSFSISKPGVQGAEAAPTERPHVSATFARVCPTRGVMPCGADILTCCRPRRLLSGRSANLRKVLLQLSWRRLAEQFQHRFRLAPPEGRRTSALRRLGVARQKGDAGLARRVERRPARGLVGLYPRQRLSVIFRAAHAHQRLARTGGSRQSDNARASCAPKQPDGDRDPQYHHRPDQQQQSGIFNPRDCRNAQCHDQTKEANLP
jgi:hypothetical protein